MKCKRKTQPNIRIRLRMVHPPRLELGTRASEFQVKCKISFIMNNILHILHNERKYLL